MEYFLTMLNLFSITSKSIIVTTPDCSCSVLGGEGDCDNTPERVPPRLLATLSPSPLKPFPKDLAACKTVAV